MNDDQGTIPEPQLAEIQETTLDHYDNNASSFWQGTRDHDVTQNYEALLKPFSDSQTLDILDFGCGPGRDLIYFKSLGHRPVGLDGSSAFCAMAREHSGCPVLHQQFLTMNLPQEGFDGIFANASLFHVPSQELPRILQELHAALRSEGILFTSNPRGSVEGWSGQRYGNYMELEVSKAYLEAAGFVIQDYYYRPPDQPRAAQPWLAIVSKKGG
jgi:SAM-dependent methyltransferase